MSAVEALVLAPALDLSPNIAQNSVGDSASLEAISSELLESSLFVPARSSPTPANSSLASGNGSSLQAMVRCDDTLGRNMNLQSCVSALATIEHTEARPFSWGPRDTGEDFNFPLPRRWVSSDGNCIIEAILFQSNYAIASLRDVAEGASSLIFECVDNKIPGEGGIAKEFGGDNKLGLFLGKRQEPATNVRCYGNAAVGAIVNSCQSIMDKMDISVTRRVFGRAGGLGVEVDLPYIWHSADHKCIMTLRTSGSADSSSWSNIWEAATFATGMCSTQGKKGLYPQIGTSKKLYLEVAAEGVGDDETS